MCKNSETYKLAEGVNLVGRKNMGSEVQTVAVALEVR